ncbi:MAG TPA: PBP1A family penicillin-binding protein [Terriglobales bacterium]|jgi:penicillin-binding protein 1A|nr:PBP1A family penicillin-binding protein [Terriglobales bacterium]
MKRVVEDPPVIAEIAPSPPRFGLKLVGNAFFALLIIIAAFAGAICGLVFVYSTDLPQVTELEHYRPSTITQLYDDQNRVIGQFALQRRVIDSYADFPKVLRDALISTEDKDFEKHWGVDVWRVFGAAWRDVLLESRAQGASTLTMQLARNLFLSPDRNFRRKMQEVMLSIQIERRFTKEQIFTLYANQIYLGHGVYGFEAGANYYFSKKAKDLNLDEAAVLAGLPKAPNYYSPIYYPERALKRRNLVINNMLEDGKITAAEAERAKSAPLELKLQAEPNDIAPYFVEEIRQDLEKKYGAEQVHEAGLRVYTGLNLEMQRAAQQALRDGLATYERRHGWKGNLQNVVSSGESIATYHHVDWDGNIEPGSYVHGLVTDVEPMAATVKFGNYEARLGPEEIKWTHHTSPSQFLNRGDLIYVKVTELNGNASRVSLEQESGVQGSLMALDNASGDVKAMVGGRDWEESKFNRAAQALRQVGSSFKPYIYTAAIDQGLTPDDTVLDAPVSFSSASGVWTPHNYDGKFEGVITFRHALAESRNIPALKVTERIGGIKTVVDYARKFGITSPLPLYLPVALGAADITLAEQTAAFTTFPNDGVRVVPRYIRKVTDYDGRVLEENYPEVRDVVSARTARIMVSMLREVVLHGTGYQASKLKHPLGGKTGTTNDFTDAWFVGFSPSLTCGVWVGYDEKKTLGNKETGAMAALPIWIDFMRVALRGRDSEDFAAPPPTTPSAVAQKLDTPDGGEGDSEAH